MLLVSSPHRTLYCSTTRFTTIFLTGAYPHRAKKSFVRQRRLRYTMPSCSCQTNTTHKWGSEGSCFLVNHRSSISQSHDPCVSTHLVCNWNQVARSSGLHWPELS